MIALGQVFELYKYRPQQIAANTVQNADAADRIYDFMHKIDIGATKVRMA